MLDTRLQLYIEGTILFIPTRRPLKVELDESEGEYMILTPNNIEWDPHTTMYRDMNMRWWTTRGTSRKMVTLESRAIT